MRVPRLACALAGLCAALPPSTLAQAPAERQALAALTDTLERLTDTVTLRVREAHLRPRAKHSDSSFARLRLGVVRLRLAGLGASPNANAAVRALREAAERQPRWPYA